MKYRTLHIFLITTLMLSGIPNKSRGNDRLPPLFDSGYVDFSLNDTIPVKKTVEPDAKSLPKNESPVKEILEPVIKTVPKSKKQVKPVAVPTVKPAKVPKIIKPKVIIRKVGL